MKNIEAATVKKRNSSTGQLDDKQG